MYSTQVLSFTGLKASNDRYHLSTPNRWERRVRAIYRTCTHLYGVFESDAGPAALRPCRPVPWPPGVLAAGRWEPGRRPRLASTLTLLACCCEPATCGAAACPPRPRSPPRPAACERGARSSGATSPGSRTVAAGVWRAGAWRAAAV